MVVGTLCVLFQLSVDLVGDGLQPFVGGLLAGDLEGQVREPAVGCRSMPMLDIRGDVNDRTGQDPYGGFALLLIPTLTSYADKHLSASFGRAMDVPVVTAARLEGDIVDNHLVVGDGGEVAVADKIAGEGRVRFSDWENHLPLESGLGVFACEFLVPDLFSQPECCPCFGPTGIKTNVGEDLGDLRSGDAILFRGLEMISQRTVRDTLADERGDRDQAAVAQPKFVGTAPDLTEKNVVVKFREFGREGAELLAASCLLDFFLCHNRCIVYRQRGKRQDDFKLCAIHEILFTGTNLS